MKRIGIRGTIIPNDYKDIYDYFGIESTCPADIIKGISEAAGDEITFEINSGGGAIFAGSEIYNAIRSHPGNKKIEIVGDRMRRALIDSADGHADGAQRQRLRGDRQSFNVRARSADAEGMR